MNWTLIVILIILAVSAAIGCKKGLIKVLFSLLAMAVIVVATTFFAPKMATALKTGTDWYDRLETKTEDYLEEAGVLLHADSLGDSEALSSLLIPSSAKETIAEKGDEYIAQGTDAYNSFVVTTVAGGIYSVMVYIGVLLAISLLVLILWGILNMLSKLPGVREVNRLGGLIAGLVVGLVIVWAGLLVVTVFFRNGLGSIISENIQSNGFLTFLYDKDPFLLLIEKFF